MEWRSQKYYIIWKCNVANDWKTDVKNDSWIKLLKQISSDYKSQKKNSNIMK